MPRRVPRKPRPKKVNVAQGYDSKWEFDIHQTILKDWMHHGEKIVYVVKHRYEPDFVKMFDNKIVLLEAKGRFWDYQEYNKYTWVRKALPKNIELVFLFSDPYAAMPQAKKRKDGSKRSHAEWADANNFRWYSEDTLPETWRVDE